MIGFAYALASVLSYSTEKVLWKKPIDRAGEWTALLWKYATVSFFLFVLAASQGSVSLDPPLYGWYLLTIAVGAVAIVAFCKSLKTGVVANSAVASSYPLVAIALAGFLYSESLSLLQVAGAVVVVLGVSGLALLKTRAGLSPLSFVALAGWGAYFVLIKPVIQSAGVIPASFLLEFGVGVLVVSYAVLTRKKLSVEEPWVVRQLVVAGALGALGSLFYYFAVSEIGVSLAAAVGGGGPALIAVLSFLILKEKLSKADYASVGLVTLGLVALAFG